MSKKMNSFSNFWRRGEPFVWLTASAQTLVLMCVAGLGLVILFNGIFVFWPKEIQEFDLSNGKSMLGEMIEKEKGPEGQRILVKVGNRDFEDQDFAWVNEKDILKGKFPKNAVVLERVEDGNFYGYFESGIFQGKIFNSWDQFGSYLEVASQKRDELHEEFIELGRISDQIEGIRLKLKKSHEKDEEEYFLDSVNELKNRYDKGLLKLDREQEILDENTVTFKTSGGHNYTAPLSHIVRAWKPNEMSIVQKVILYLEKIFELLFDEPRESNTEGGLFPAIVGTVMLVFVMSIVAFPLGMVAGVYLAEYAREGNILRIVRIAVNNLAGIPSIVYGIFGLGFFVYGMGGTLDDLFFSDRLPQPTFGTGGILWASLTLSILTVPVVIVATEEALRTVPNILRNGSLALGATRFQTLIRVLIPAAAPGILTGFILAMARAAGEVAPLMVTGVVKLAPSLPLDGEFPFFHLDRKFMHLGFHIYDVGFQSPNAEAARPMVFITTLLLVGIVLVMNLAAMHLRQKLRDRLTIKTF